MVSQSLSQQSTPILSATAHDIRHIAAVLRGVNFGTHQRATVDILSAGLTILVEEARSLIAQAYLPLSAFETYEYSPPDNLSAAGGHTASDGVRFEIDLYALLTCLDMFGTAGGPSQTGSTLRTQKSRNTNKEDGEWGENDDTRGIERYFSSDKVTGMRMSYIGEGHPLTIIISEEGSGPVTSCHITTLEPEPAGLALPFDDEDKVVKVILKSSWLSEALSELDSCDKLTILCTPPTVPLPQSNSEPPSSFFTNRTASSKARFRLLGTGSFGSTEIDFPNDRDVLETFECEEQVSFSYRFSHIHRASRAMQGSVKTSLRINDEGVLDLQFMMPTAKLRSNDGDNPFIEFKCMALEEDL
ncbi:ssDNA endodeoxyribonuclease [Tulasnella sp. 419]|nr:ssDNA endodeoxyribonuclease [Tulasnella sp. 419]